MGIKHIVRLSAEERRELERLIHFGVTSTHKNIRARILLKSDQGEGKAWLSDTDPYVRFCGWTAPRAFGPGDLRPDKSIAGRTLVIAKKTVSIGDSLRQMPA